MNMSFKLNFNQDVTIFTPQALNQLMDYMTQYSFNNFVQKGVEKIITSIIEGFNKELKVMLFEHCNLLEFIVTNMNNMNFILQSDTNKSIKQGYIG